MVCGGPASTISHSHHNRDGCVLLRVGAPSVIHAQEEVGAASTTDAVEQKTFRDSQRVACPSVGTPRERSHGGRGCSHQLRAQVLGGSVIKFLQARKFPDARDAQSRTSNKCPDEPLSGIKSVMSHARGEVRLYSSAPLPRRTRRDCVAPDCRCTCEQRTEPTCGST